MNISLFILWFLFSSGNQAKNLPLIQQPASGTLTLMAQKVVMESGKTVCISIAAADFRNLISMQYSLKWDPAVLEFENVQSFMLPWLNKDNYGTHLTKNGLLTFVWIDQSLQGVTKANGDPLYEICFRVKGKPGSASLIEFSEKPTPFEVVDLMEQLWKLNGMAGKVTVK